MAAGHGGATAVLGTVARGALAGAAATAIMTVAQLQVFPRILPASMQRRFLPRAVLRGSQRKTLGRRVVHGRTEDVVVLLAHHGFGATGGAIYALLPGRNGHAVVRGIGFGLAVWAVSYEGWIPATGILPATTDRPPRKWWEPIAAHAVYGAALGVADAMLRPRMPPFSRER